MHAALILVEDLHLLRVETGFLEKVSCGEALVERVARNETTETHLHERPEIARRTMRKVHDPARLAVDHENVTFANVCGFHGSGNINRLP